jgi:hypothetical protein
VGPRRAGAHVCVTTHPGHPFFWQVSRPQQAGAERTGAWDASLQAPRCGGMRGSSWKCHRQESRCWRFVRARGPSPLARRARSASQTVCRQTKKAQSWALCASLMAPRLPRGAARETGEQGEAGERAEFPRANATLVVSSDKLLLGWSGEGVNSAEVRVGEGAERESPSCVCTSAMPACRPAGALAPGERKEIERTRILAGAAMGAIKCQGQL